MKRWLFLLFLALGFLLGLSQVVRAQQAIPTLTARVIDQTGTLSASEIASLDQTLSQFEARKGSQVVALIIPTTAPESIEQYGIRLGDQWKIGRKKVDDGAVLIIAKDDRALRIEVGYGLEGVLTDVTSKRIIDQVIVPRFKQQDFYGGIVAGVNAVMTVIDGEALPPPMHTPSNDNHAQPDFGSFFPVILIVALILGGILRSMLGRLPGSLVTGGFVAVMAWFIFGAISMALMAGIVALVVALTGIGFGGRGFGGYSSGGGGGGGFSGGGGGFGGGGSSGRW